MSAPEVHVIFTPTNLSEKKYIFDVLIKDFLQLSYTYEVNSKAKSFLIQKGNNKVLIPDIFFSKKYDSDLPELPSLKEIQVKLSSYLTQKIPAWFIDDKSNSFSVNEHSEKLPADVIGMAFFLLTGYADIHFSEKDEHMRSKGETSFVVQNNLIDRPFIQEWFRVIAQMLYVEEQVRPGKQIPGYSKHVSHDVDQPFEYLFYTKPRLVKRLTGDLLARKSFRLAKSRFKKYRMVKKGNYLSDPYNNFEELISLLKKEGIKSTFFFVSGENKSKYDVHYEINHPALKKIIKALYETGHRIGLHPSYDTMNDEEKLKSELKALKEVCNSIGVKAEIDQTRKHYLRWDWKKTPSILQKAGIKHDYTVGYADRTGFRTGVAFPYRAFNWQEMKSLDIKLHPLIVMEASLLSEKYMGLTLEQAEEKIVHYHEQLQQIGGEFVLLWHNHWLLDEKLNLFKTFLRL
ncbi:MAG: polysaccharide deacetylase family protein [Gracilimonas sp.]|nr:polysaccharide deacetylase family protein [Gracilimonas sp.]